MAQEDYVIADQTGVSFLADLNNTLAAIVSNNSGATEPTTMYAYQLWADTNAGILKQRNSANNAWINILTLAGIKSSDIRNTAAGGIAATTVQAALNELDTDKAALAGADFTGPVKSTSGAFNLVTNTALSDAADTLTAAQLIGGEFTITPTAARIQTLDTATNIISALSGSVDNSNFEFTIVNLAAFDVTVATASGVTLVGSMVVNNGSANFRIRRTSSSSVSVTRLETVSSSSGINLQTPVATTSGTSIDFIDIPSGAKRFTFTLNGVSTNGSSNYIIQLGDAGGFETSGFLGAMIRFGNSPDNHANTSGHNFVNPSADKFYYGQVTFQLSSSAAFTWSGSSNTSMQDASANFSAISSSSKALSAELTQIRITTAGGSDTFDAGSVTLSLEF